MSEGGAEPRAPTNYPCPCLCARPGRGRTRQCGAPACLLARRPGGFAFEPHRRGRKCRRDDGRSCAKDRSVSSTKADRAAEPIYPALVSVQNAASALLATSGGIACSTQGAAAATGGDTIADDDARAEDVSGDGLVEQLDVVATVVGQANARLIGIAQIVGSNSGPSEIEAAAAVWAHAAAIFNRTVDLLANTNYTPPSPVCPAP